MSPRFGRRDRSGIQVSSTRSPTSTSRWPTRRCVAGAPTPGPRAKCTGSRRSPPRSWSGIPSPVATSATSTLPARRRRICAGLALSWRSTLMFGCLVVSRAIARGAGAAAAVGKAAMTSRPARRFRTPATSCRAPSTRRGQRRFGVWWRHRGSVDAANSHVWAARADPPQVRPPGRTHGRTSAADCAQQPARRGRPAPQGHIRRACIGDPRLLSTKLSTNRSRVVPTLRPNA